MPNPSQILGGFTRVRHTTRACLLWAASRRRPWPAGLPGENLTTFFSDSCNVDPELLETNHGAWEGLHKSEVAIRWSDLYIRWQTAPADVVFPGGEAYQDTAARAVNWFNRIAKMSGTVAAVTHLNIIQAIIAHILGLDPNSIQNYPIHPTGVTLIEYRSPP